MKIDKNIPVPDTPLQKYPFPDMSIGDSFLANNKVRSASRIYGTRHGVKFTCRKVLESDKVRCWRTK